MNTRITTALTAIFTLFLFSNNLQAQQGMGVGNANPQEMLDVTGAIKIGTDINNSNAAPSGGAGTIRFRAGQFEGWDGTSWIPLGGGGGTSPFVLNGNLVQPDNTVVNLATDDFIFGSPSLDDNANTDNDTRFFFDKSKGAFRAGSVTGDQWNDIKRGNQSFAVGYDVTASGNYSMTLGEKSRATGLNAIALGRKAYAYGDRSFAWGNDVEASGEGSVAFGQLSTATADFSYASGNQVAASGQYSVAIGVNAQASNYASIAMGDGVIASGESALAIGNGSTASGLKSVAAGWNNLASGQQSFAVGHNTTASGRYAFTIGKDVTASGRSAMAIGENTNALSAYELAVGRYNELYTPVSTTDWNAADHIFSVGIGTGISNRSNALTILKNGNTGIGTSTPSATLHVDGTMRYVDGNQAAGFVATSDANGNITWTDPTTISTAADADGDATNELQTLSISGNDISLSNGGGTVSVPNDGDWTISGNNQYSAVSGNVGVGTTTPTSKLHVAGGGWFENNLTTEGDVRFENTNGTGSNNPLFRLDGFADKMYIVAEGGTNGPTNGTEIRFRTSGGGTAIDRMTIDNAGNVGVGTTAPAEKLHVNGSIQMEDGNEQAGYIPVSDANGKMTWTDPITLATANDGDWTVSGNDQYSAVSGSVGIGTNAPTSKLHIQSGDLLINDPISNNSATRKISIAGARIGDQNPYAILEFVNRDADDSNTAYVGASIRSHNDGSTDGGDMRLFTNASERVRINGSGNVGVGITAPVAKLHVGSSATGDSFGIRLTQGSANSLIYHNADNDLIIRKAAETDQLVLDNDGNIGIGTDAPANKLHVEGAIRMVDGNQQAGYIPVSDANGKMTWTDPTTINTAADDDWLTSSSHIYNGNAGNIGIGTSTPDRQLNIESATGPQMLFTRNDNNTTDGEMMGELLFDNNDDTAPSSVDAAAVIRATASGNQGNSNKGGNIVFLTKNNQPGTVNATERMRIAANGNVGVGTSTPDQKLHVEGAIRMVDGNQQAGYIPVSDANGKMTWTDPTTLTTAVDGDGDATNELQTLSIAGNDITLSDGGGTVSVPNDSDWTISGNDQYSAVSGNVGIGTTTPDEILHVSRNSGNAIVKIESPGGSYEARMEVHKFGSFSAGVGYYPGNADLRLRTNGSQAIVFEPNGTENMRVTPAGNVGVGTQTPGAKLQVVGNAIIGGTGQTNSGSISLVVGSSNTNSGERSLVAGNNHNVTATHALVAGNSNTVAGNYSVVLNNSNSNTTAATTSIVGGFQSSVSANLGVAIGWGNTSSAVAATAFGRGNEAHSFGEFVVGTFNTDYTPNNVDGIDASDRIFTVGNGTSASDRSNAMTVLKNGNIGIGTDAPANKLHVAGSIRMVDGNQQAGYIPVSDANGTMTWTDPLNLSVSELSDADNDTKIQVEESADEDRIRFDAGGTERMIIDSNGKVGIGTSSPVDQLHVVGGATLGRKASGVNTENVLKIEGKLEGNVNPYVSINFQNIDSNSGNTDYVGASIRSHNNGSSDDGDLRFYTTSDQTLSEAMRIDHLGIVSVNEQLGVGTQTPDSKLHVSSGSTGDAAGIKLTQGIANSLIYHNSDNDLVIRKAAQTDQLVLDNDGNVGIGTSSPNSKFHVTTSGLNGFESYAARIENTSNWSNYSNGLRITAGQNAQTDNNRFISFRRPDGTEVGAVRQTSSSSVDFWSPSDQRLKTNIQATTKGLADLMQLQVKDYVYKDDPEKPQTGFIAQEVYEVFPNAVSVGGDDAKTDPWMMNYGNLTPLLVKAVQDQQAEIEALRRQNEAILQELEVLRNK